MRADRRRFLHWLGRAGLGLGVLALPRIPAAAARASWTHAIPASGERIPVIGMGSWLTFDVGDHAEARAARLEVLRACFSHGGGMIDSSPMYGLSEEVIGWCLAHLKDKPGLFTGTKVWTPGRRLGILQMESSEKLWGTDRFDLMQIHNMLDWETHLATLKEWKAAGASVISASPPRTAGATRNWRLR